ncbi:response regulator transcription factor [Sphingorhabdus soli]|uniref:Response regulator transcription factor n=1 Tax=Flavisphingopyxis soli TaxID=2601267 RepID=A0A5C6UKX3_9SPHN|nr:response regulator transcription factor [Sphingorhabdus soli]TXC73812.1 response regulator transcription factor [Sphingorhabdus soli]
MTYPATRYCCGQLWAYPVELACLDETATHGPVALVRGFDGSGERCAALAGLRAAHPAVALIVLLRDYELALCISAFESGADDVFDEAGDPRELSVRIAALGRLVALSALPIVRGPLVINPIDRQVTRAGRPIAMTAREYQLLIYLARRANRYIATETLRARVWGQAFDPGTNSVAVHVSRLRQRIDHGFDWAMLRSAKARGYALASTPDGLPIG